MLARWSTVQRGKPLLQRALCARSRGRLLLLFCLCPGRAAVHEPLGLLRCPFRLHRSCRAESMP